MPAPSKAMSFHEWLKNATDKDVDEMLEYVECNFHINATDLIHFKLERD